ncbi:EF-P lysine aminoacylase EpmA [Pseudoxanthomonas dokdonensis]|uniref:Lysyl-tRNA synthetase n=1 Tax=Pseudoxanthomonas dokdonensis TaxID=344882 RepID=A0A0R0CXW3_9GAMM|nr:EF-P lysine aminoacylase EpmA [Pseudoxanthomonas dokdonensis]KRG70673.1 lysyl-tRNA synthetase [Pseudoxanthomonas dokdonensis]
MSPAAADWQPTAGLDAIRLRARLNALIRGFFAERDVLEVETPILSRAGNTDANIASFQVQFSGHVDAGPRQRWLRTSPEFPLKRLLAAGIGDCYELGRVFRDGEAGGRHNPEFTMLEWYRVGWDHHALIDETVVLVQQALALVGRQAQVRVLDYRQLFQEVLSLDPFSASVAQLQQPLSAFSINGEGLQRDDWLDLLITHCIQPRFADDVITVVHDWPASQAALARIRPGQPPLAERFELYLGSFEIANGYHELNDAEEQRDRFLRDNRIRDQRGDIQPAIDHALLAALPSLPDCAGVAVGVDRLLMAMLRSSTIAPLLAFDFAHA